MLHVGTNNWLVLINGLMDLHLKLAADKLVVLLSQYKKVFNVKEK